MDDLQHGAAFVRAGARLSDPDKIRLKALNSEIASLQTTFSQNVLNEKNTNSVIVHERAELAGGKSRSGASSMPARRSS